MFKKIGLMLAAVLFASGAFAAVTPNSNVTVQTPNRGVLQFTSSTTPGTYATAYTAGANGSKISGIFISNDDNSATHLVTCGVFNGGIQYASWVVTTTSPSSGSYNNLGFLTSWTGLPIDSDSNPYLILVSGDTLQCTYATAVTSGKAVNVHVVVGDF